MHLVQELNVGTVCLIVLIGMRCPWHRILYKCLKGTIWLEWTQNNIKTCLFISSHIQCWHLIHVQNVWAARAWYTTARPVVTQFLDHGCMDDLTIKRTFDSQATCVIDVLGLYFEMLSMGMCTTRHWQISGRLVQWIKCLNCTWVKVFWMSSYNTD